MQGLFLPKKTEREKWERLDPDLKKALVEEGERCQKEEWSRFLLSDYREFKKSGDRKKFEDKYFSRRYKLNGMIMAECVESKGRFLDDIIDGIYLILQEVSWCLPPHNSYYRDEPQLEIPDSTRPVLDLFAAETGALLKTVVTVLGEDLDRISPAIRRAVHDALEIRVIEPFCTWHFWWLGRDGEEMCNWTPWIIQNVLLTIFPEWVAASEAKAEGMKAETGSRQEEETCSEDSFGPLSEDHPGYPAPLMKFEGASASYRSRYYDTMEKAEKILARSAKAVDHFLDEYEEDGCCDEGAQYYSHAGLCLFGCMNLLNRIRPGSLEEAFKTTKIRNMANYICKMHVQGQYYINFADCSPFPGRRGSRDYLFAKATGDPVFASFAASDYREGDLSEKIMEKEINLYYRLQQVFTHDAMMKEPVIPENPADVFLESQGLMICRDSRYTLAAKAGDNGDSHNHNDVGSITLYKDGKPFLIDLGVETYSAKTFSNRRYEIWTMQSGYHNLPTFAEKTLAAAAGETAGADTASEATGSGKGAWDENPVMQLPGSEYGAREVSCLLDEREPKLAMDIAPAYGRKEIRSYRRSVSLKKEEGVEILDVYDGDLPCRLSLMTYEPVEVSEKTEGDGICLQVGTLGTILAEGAEEAIVEECPINDARLQIAWKHSCYRTLLTFRGRELHLKIR